MNPDIQIARMQDRVVDRYNLVAVPGRPEERIKPNDERGVSFAYSGNTIRVRPMRGRTWVDELVTDFAVAGNWAPKLDALLDPFFGKCPISSDPSLGNDACNCGTHAVKPNSLIFNHPNTGQPLSDINVGLGDGHAMVHVPLIPTPDMLARRAIRDNPQA